MYALPGMCIYIPHSSDKTSIKAEVENMLIEKFTSLIVQIKQKNPNMK